VLKPLEPEPTQRKTSPVTNSELIPVKHILFLSLDLSPQRHGGLNCNYCPVRHGLKITVLFNVLTIYSAPRPTARKLGTRTAHRD